MKHLLLSSVMLLTGFTAFAQLYVTPDSGNDSYIYVSDQVLFVEDDIELDVNPTAATAASIYLRNNAQLVQGSGILPNSGDGYISVIQDSHSDSYDYNFWSSPVGQATGSGNQNFGILRVNDSLGVTNSTVTSTTAALNGTGYGGGFMPMGTALNISRRWLYKREAGAGWTAIGTSNNVTPGHGFIMKGTNVTTLGDGTTANADVNSQQYDFRGRANNGNIIVPVLLNRVTLSGNPYPSALDLNLVFNDIDNLEIDSFRYWDEDRSINSHEYAQNKGGYGTWVPGPQPYIDGGAYTPPTFLNYNASGNPSGGSTGTGVATERLFAPIGQGFHIFGALPGTIIYKNSHRVYMSEGAANNSEFRGPADTNNPANLSDAGGNEPQYEVVPNVRIQTIFGEDSHYRELLMYLFEDSTDGYDRGLDATHPMDGATAEAYFPIKFDNNQTKNLVIQTLPYGPEKKIPFAFELDQQTKVIVQTDAATNLPGPMYIWDSEDDKYQRITGGEKAGFFLPAGVYETRFFIVFQNQRDLNEETIAIEDEVRANVQFFQNNKIGQLEVRNPEGYDIANANIFDISGKLVYSAQNVGTSRNFSFPTGNLSDGVYIVKMITVDNVNIDYKISVFNKR